MNLKKIPKESSTPPPKKKNSNACTSLNNNCINQQDFGLVKVVWDTLQYFQG